ncbi:outer membrane beta-barrel protein [Deinococcus alpinitundrae]|uniref:outer membrane beta-barrel protein n=1 Tax=Deinococcus alpinitundrae TaxID=468913 RepID=UPI00137A7ABA|nr:outer membrane beta-barrel protein [Deinococcus alpinitundrae]
MHAVRSSLTLVALSLAAAASAQPVSTPPDTAQPFASPGAAFSSPFLSTVEVGLTGGYAAGGSIQVTVSRADLLGPLGVRLSLGRSGSDPSPVGGQQAHLTLLTYGLDATYNFGQPVPGVATSVYGGPRYGQLILRPDGSGDPSNEANAGALGLGVGAQVGYLLTNAFSFIAELGLDQYLGTAKAVSQAAPERPGTVFKALLGVKYRF